MIGNDIISYETHVATIDGDKIIEHGKYSKTTSKHISYVAELLKLEVVPNKTKMKNQFDKLQYGVRCFVDSAISKSSSLKILSSRHRANDSELENGRFPPQILIPLLDCSRLPDEAEPNKNPTQHA